MGIPVLILGESGTGKSTSLRNLNPESTLLIQAVRKPLPFRAIGWEVYCPASKKGSILYSDNWEAIKKFISHAHERGKDKVIIDDFQYVMANEFMRRSGERGFDKFTEIAHHAWSLIMAAQEVQADTRVYFLSHTSTDDSGTVRAKTIGKLLDEKITVEGLFTIVLRSFTNDQGYFFSTQNNGFDTVKSPMDMFAEQHIENDLNAVDSVISEYYGINKTNQEAA